MMLTTLDIKLEDYKTLFDNIKEGVYFSAVDGKVLSCNKSFLKITGYNESDLLFANQLYVKASDRLAFQKKIEDDGFVNEFEVKLKTKEGIEIFCDLSSNPFYDQSGKMIGYTGILRNITRRKQAEQKLKEEKRKRLLDITHIQEREKKRIARELHDGLGQLLFGTKMKLDKLAKKLKTEEKLMELVEGVENGLTQSMQETRRLSRALRPSVIDDFGVIAALEQLFEQYNHGTGVEVKLKTKLKNVKISNQADIAIYRIVQESLSNATKHGKADTVYVSIVEHDNYVKLSIVDNGKGFTQVGMEKGHGLKNITERAEIIGGEVIVNTEKNVGTTINVIIPKR